MRFQKLSAEVIFKRDIDKPPGKKALGELAKIKEPLKEPQ
jgi:hypothetical protein